MPGKLKFENNKKINFNCSKSERKPKEKSTRASYHRSTPDLLQAPINPIYQPRERDSSFVTEI